MFETRKDTQRGLVSVRLRRLETGRPGRSNLVQTTVQFSGSAGKRGRDHILSCRRYVAAAYLVFLGFLLLYVLIMATRLRKIESGLAELEELTRDTTEKASSEPVTAVGGSSN